ncbi:MAG: hypothetical protein II723_07285 [Oscillospiraceae bacterium]|nr:hypothetical protein [Oscillospiraceae bacterium]
MSKLLSADFARLFMSKTFRIIMVICFAMGPLFNLVNMSGSDQKTLAGSVEPGVLFLLPMMLTAVMGLNVVSEFTNGSIRNKIMIGHSRRAICFSWIIVYTAVMLTMFAVFFGTAFLSGRLMGFDMAGIEAGKLAANTGVMLCSLLTNLIFSLTVCVAFADYRGLAVLYLLMEFPVVGFSLISMAYPESKVLKFIFRFFTGGLMTDHLSLSLLTWPDKGWLTVLCTLSFGAVLLAVLLRHFSAKDLK